MAEGQLLLWGYRAVGKTTLLATGLLAYPERLPAIDWTAEPLAGKERLLHHWRRLKLNQHIQQTTELEVLELGLANGHRLILRDIQGLHTLRPLAEEGFRGLVQGVLFVCEWMGPDIANDMAAVESGLHLCRNLAVGLALTKSERGMDADDPHWHAPLGWWRSHDCWRPYARVLEAFGDRVWPTSAYGFDADGRPACLLNEFGQLMPYRIAPRNVEAPFRWFLRELKLWQE